MCEYALRKPMQYTCTVIFKVVKNGIFQQKKFDIFVISAQNIDCGHTLEPPRRGGSNEYPQSMFLSKYKKNKSTTLNPFYHINVGYVGVYISTDKFS